MDRQSRTEDIHRDVKNARVECGQKCNFFAKVRTLTRQYLRHHAIKFDETSDYDSSYTSLVVMLISRQWVNHNMSFEMIISRFLVKNSIFPRFWTVIGQ